MRLNRLFEIRGSLLILTLWLACGLAAAESPVAGSWEGVLEVGPQKLKIVFHVAAADDGTLTSTMDSPDQGAFGLPTGSTTFEDGVLSIDAPNLYATFSGKLAEDGGSLGGTWSQRGTSLDLTLTRAAGGEEAAGDEEPAVSTAAEGCPALGDWLGSMQVGPQKLRIVFHVGTGDDGLLLTTMDSPDQGAEGIPTGVTRFVDGKLSITVPRIRGSFEGSLAEDGNSVAGTWSQGGMNFDLELKRTEGPVENAARPQDPKEPFPYRSEDVTFENESAGIALAGTLTLPEGDGPFPGVILVSGSGPQNRDEELMNHRPFLVLSDYLTRRGIAVLRYDDRGVGESGGEFQGATTADFASDAEAAVAYLRGRSEIAKGKVGIAGHSEGGLVAPMVASRSKKAVDFIVVMAGPGTTGEQILYQQSEAIMRANGAAEEIVEKSLVQSRKIYTILKESSADEAPAKIRAFINQELASLSDAEKAALGIPEGPTDSVVDAQVNQLTTPWFRYFLTYDPIPALEKVKQPVLLITGAKDLQVLASENIPQMEAALKRAGNKQVESVTMPGLNHLFQTAQTGSPTEYASIDETWAPAAMQRIAEWILGVTG